jgi:hypothetical protein
MKSLQDVFNAVQQIQNPKIRADRIKALCAEFQLSQSQIAKLTRKLLRLEKKRKRRQKRHSKRKQKRIQIETFRLEMEVARQTMIPKELALAYPNSFNLKAPKSGQDLYSNMSLSSLRILVGETKSIEAIVSDAEKASAYRWVMRGLPADFAVKAITRSQGNKCKMAGHKDPEVLNSFPADTLCPRSDTLCPPLIVTAERSAMTIDQ